MEIKYRWERNECYMLVDAGEISADHYQLRMLEKNRIDGLLKVQLRQINQQSEFCYAISGRQSMTQRYENVCINVEEIKKLMAALNRTAGQLEEFLLNIDSLRLEPEWIYWKEDGEGLPEFCYYPEEVPCKSFREQIRTLLQYLLNKISHKDSEAVNAAYGLYQISMKETFRMQELMQFLFYGAEENEEFDREENLLSEIGQDTEWRADDAYEITDYEMIDGEGGRKRQRQKQQRQKKPKEKQSPQKSKEKQEHSQEEGQSRKQRGKKQRLLKGQQRTPGLRRSADYVLAFLVAALALAAVLRLAFLWYGRREVMSEKETILHIGLICVIVIISGMAVYKLMAKTDVSAAAVWESPEESADRNRAQDYGQIQGDFADEYAAAKGTDGWEITRRPKDSFRWETIPESQYASICRGDMPEQENMPEETCVLTGVSDSLTDGWWFRCQGHEKNIEDFFLSGREGRFMVGKKLKAPDIALNWPTVSRYHAVFQIQRGICTVRDCGSTNGTYVDGDRLDRGETRVLFSGSELKFADVVFRVEESDRSENATTILTGP